LNGDVAIVCAFKAGCPTLQSGVQGVADGLRLCRSVNFYDLQFSPDPFEDCDAPFGPSKVVRQQLDNLLIGSSFDRRNVDANNVRPIGLRQDFPFSRIWLHPNIDSQLIISSLR
jgi:hypothetical protein